MDHWTHVPTDLPSQWSSREPDERDIAPLAMLRAAVTRAATGGGAPDVSTVLSEVTEAGSWTRRQVIVLDPDGNIRAWAAAHDRAAGRTLVHVTVDPALPPEQAGQLAQSLFAWVEGAARGFAALRGLESSQLDSGSYADDSRQRRWLEQVGYVRTRGWLQMSRPVELAESEPAAFPPPREGVVVRPVRVRPNSLPVAADVQTVHRVLEESFVDHFNSYRESFPEFVHRLLEDPGHSWDHWWLATVEVDGETLPGGAIVATALSADSTGAAGSYVDYIGVHKRSRGRGVAKALLATVIADAARRGANRVDLEVDDDSPTRADGLYRSLGWEVSYVTESWHKEISRSS